MSDVLDHLHDPVVRRRARACKLCGTRILLVGDGKGFAVALDLESRAYDLDADAVAVRVPTAFAEHDCKKGNR